MQYGSYYIASGRRYASGITRGTPNRSPEDATSDDIIYNVCSAFPHDVYFEAFGEHVLTEDMAVPSCALINAVNFDADNVLSYVSPVSAADDSAAMAACIGDTEYTTLTQALAAAVDGDTVTVLKNIRLDSEEGNGSSKVYPFVINQDITLDLNGHTISDEGLAGDGTALKGLLYVNSSTVTIQNGTLRSAGSVAALSCNGTIDVTLKDMNVINSVSRAIRQSSGGSGNMLISGGFYSGGSATLPTIEIQQSSETATVILQLKDGVVVHGENNSTVLKMGTNTSAVITEATLTTNAESDNGQLYSGSVSTDALVIDAIPMNSKFVYGRQYLPSGTKAVIGNETYTSLSQAISAAKAGDTIILTADIHTENESGTKVGSNIAQYPLQLNMDMTLDLNGHIIADTLDSVHIPEGEAHLKAPARRMEKSQGPAVSVGMYKPRFSLPPATATQPSSQIPPAQIPERLQTPAPSAVMCRLK